MSHGHDEVAVGGPLDDVRLRAIMVRGFLFRNLCINATEAFTYRDPHDPKPGETMPWSEYQHHGQHTDGETPMLVWRERKDIDGSVEIATACMEVHVGCGDVCPVFAIIPYDGDSGGVPSSNAEAIAHAGRDLIDLVREVTRLRAEIDVLRLVRP